MRRVVAAMMRVPATATVVVEVSKLSNMIAAVAATGAATVILRVRWATGAKTYAMRGPKG
jgi:hypothetical protein